MNHINDFLAAAQEAQSNGLSIDDLVENISALAASGKTPLGLNRWVDTDKPKMEDFNRDNEILDREIAAIKANKVNNIIDIQSGDFGQLKDLPSGFYRIGPTVIGTPESGQWWLVKSVSDEHGSVWMQAHNVNTQETFELDCVGGAWGTWRQTGTHEELVGKVDKTKIITSGDLSQLVGMDTGSFILSDTVTGGPLSDTWYFAQTVSLPPGTLLIRLTVMSTTNPDDYKIIYSSGSWSNWKKVTEADIDR